jgi:hypothetical protein
MRADFTYLYYFYISHENAMRRPRQHNGFHEHAYFFRAILFFKALQIEAAIIEGLQYNMYF